jgi:hypothetical protein
MEPPHQVLEQPLPEQQDQQLTTQQAEEQPELTVWEQQPATIQQAVISALTAELQEPQPEQLQEPQWVLLEAQRTTQVKMVVTVQLQVQELQAEDLLIITKQASGLQATQLVTEQQPEEHQPIQKHQLMLIQEMEPLQAAAALQLREAQQVDLQLQGILQAEINPGCQQAALPHQAVAPAEANQVCQQVELPVVRAHLEQRKIQVQKPIPPKVALLQDLKQELLLDLKPELTLVADQKVQQLVLVAVLILQEDPLQVREQQRVQDRIHRDQQLPDQIRVLQLINKIRQEFAPCILQGAFSI